MDPFPPSWTDSVDAVGFWQRLRSATQSLLMLDYDGTLAPFHEDRMQAFAYPEVEERLLTLSTLPGVSLVMVTGRGARELRGLLHSDIKADIWGSHGRELLTSVQAYKLFALDSVQQATLQHVIREMTALGFPETLEIKPASVAVHWRSCEPELQEQIRRRLQSVYEGVGEAGRLQLLPFEGGLELRSSDRTKGTAVREILSRQAGSVPAAYLGDDLTDEDAFAAIRNRGLTLLVRSEVRRSCARFWLRPPEELVAFLDGWIAMSRGQVAAESVAAGAPR